MRLAPLGVAIVGLLGACAPIEAPELGADPLTSSTSVVGEESQGELGTTEEVEVSEVLRDFAPSRPVGYTPSVVVGTSLGIQVHDAGEEPVLLTEPLLSTVATRVIDDFFGGLLVQTEAGQIEWFGAEGGDAIVLSPGGSKLLDVGFLDATGAIHALVSTEGSRIDTIRLDGGEPVEFVSLSEGETVLDLSASNGLHAAVIADENCGDLVFFDALGEQVDLGGLGTPACVVARRPAYGSVALSPDRSSVVYTELTYRSDGVVSQTRLVVRQLDTSMDPVELVIGGANEQIRSLDFDGQRVLYVRVGVDASTVELLDPFSQEPATVLEGDDPQVVTFARQRLVVGRDTLQE